METEEDDEENEEEYSDDDDMSWKVGSLLRNQWSFALLILVYLRFADVQPNV